MSWAGIDVAVKRLADAKVIAAADPDGAGGIPALERERESVSVRKGKRERESQ